MIVRINQVMVTIPIRTTFGAGGFFNPKSVTFPLSAMWAPGNLKYMLSCCLFRLSNLSASLRVRKRTSPTSGDCRGADYLRIMKGEPGGGVRFLHWWWWCWWWQVGVLRIIFKRGFEKIGQNSYTKFQQFLVIRTQKMSVSGEIYTTGTTFTLALEVTGGTNLISV